MLELDHLVLPVTDLDAASAMCSDAGFVVTPETVHPFGTSNRLVVFEGAYLELVGVADQGRLPGAGFARQVADHLEEGRIGFSLLACRATSIGDAGAAVREAGLEAGEPMWFSRPAPRTDGSILTASFTLLPIVDHPSQFFCVHHTPDAIWFRPHLRHSNGVRRIEQVASRLSHAVAILAVELGDDQIGFDSTLKPIEITGVRLG